MSRWSDGAVDGVDRLETVLPSTPASPGVARRFVGAALRRWDAEPSTIEAAQLLVSELVTNAVVHTQFRGPARGERAGRQDPGGGG